MSDGDTRIHTDLAQAVDGMAKTFSDALFSCTTGIFYTFEIWRWPPLRCRSVIYLAPSSW